MKKKKAITLLEVIIGLALIGIMLSTLMSYVRKTMLLDAKIQKAQTEVLTRAKLQNRLNQIFSHLDFDHELGIEPIISFEEDPIELHFLFDNGVDLEQDFSGIVNGSLYLNTDHQLVLDIFPEHNRELRRNEILYEEIQSFQFEFFRFDKEEFPPHAIQIKIKKNDELFIFPIFLMNQEFDGVIYQ